MNPRQIKEYYSNPELINHILDISRQREVVPAYSMVFKKRPSVLNMPGDFLAWVEQGATSFHCSVEKWNNPLNIGKEDHITLRNGWDLVIDIDASKEHMMQHRSGDNLKFNYITAKLLLETLERFGIKNVGVKFSGSRGFHLMVAKNAFPDSIRGKPLSEWYPELPKAIINFLREQIREPLSKELMGTYSSSYSIDPFKIIDIENSWSVRHLFRMPYSLNEKTWLASLPLTRKELENFRTIQAVPQNIRFKTSFVPKNKDNEATDLIIEALEFSSRQKAQETESREVKVKNYEKEEFTDQIPKEYFPKPILTLLDGVTDGRKRALFILLAFFRNLNYSWKAIEDEIDLWNNKNKEPLGEAYIHGQIAWHKRQQKPVLPPNYNTEGYYNEILPSEVFTKITATNPVSEAIFRYKSAKNPYNKGKVSKAKQGFVCDNCKNKFNSMQKFREHTDKCMSNQ